MRLVKGDDKEIIVVTVLLHIVERPLHDAVSVCKLRLYVLVIHRLRHTRLYAVMIVPQLLKISAHIVPVIGIPPVGADTVAEIIAAVKMPLADISGTYAVVMQSLTDGVNIVAKRHAVRP